MASRPLTNDEITTILSTLLSLRDRCLFVLGIKTGYRISELLSLKPDEVMQYGEVREEITVKRSAMKGGRKSRTVKLHPMAQEAITAYMAGAKPEHRLFPFTRMTAHRIVQRIVEAHKLKGRVSFHSLRKTFGMHVYSRTGQNIVAAQMALGHSSLSSTTHYLSVGQDTVDKAVLED